MVLAPPSNVQRYEPVGSARELIAAREPEVLAVGPAGTGKTLAIAWKIHLAALRYPGARILMTRATLESLKPAALTTYSNGVDPERSGVRYFGGNSVTPSEFRYPNGSVIQVSSLEKPEKVKSAEYDIIYVNESTEIPESTWEMLKSRLRNGAMPYQQIIGDCNPAGPRHWLKVRCESGLTRMIISTHQDNPAYWDRRTGSWTAVGYAYVQQVLANLKGVARKRLFQGLWAAAEGLVYTEFDTATHVRRTYRPEDFISNTTGQMVDVIVDGNEAIHRAQTVDVQTWRTVIGADVGTTNPTAILTGHFAGDERVHISRELYRRKMTSSDIVSAIEQEFDRAGAEFIHIDPSAASYIGDLERDGYPVNKPNNDILIGIQRVRSAFQTGFTIDPSCVETINEFLTYAYPENPRVETEKPKPEYDHALDALRYMVMGEIADLTGEIREPTGDLLEYLSNM